MQIAEPILVWTARSRILLCATVLLIESLAVASLPHPWFHPQQIMAAPIAAGAAFLLLAWRDRQIVRLPVAPVRRVFVGLHAFALTATSTTTFFLLHRPFSEPAHRICLVLWYLAIAALITTLATAFLPLKALARALLSLRWQWLLIALTAAATMSARTLLRWLWNAPDSHLGHALQSATFASVQALLSLCYARTVARPDLLILGTPRFHVQIAGECSGIEGLALILIFTAAWLAWMRQDLRWPRALLLIPAALLLSWSLNTLRIATLIALGDAGHSELAINGFHSEAGWILFNVVAIAFLLTAQRVQWLQKNIEPTQASSQTRNAAAPYLIPFLAVLATAMLTHAASTNFDWLYPLRFIIGLAALLYFRKDYSQVDRRFGWLGLSAGLLVFAVWLAAARLQPASVSLLAGDLLALPAWQRILWITAHVLAAVITVPLAEELAFRGYLARRIVNEDVELVPFARLTLTSIALSSLSFGLLQGRMWIAGIAAGVIFALVAKLRDRLGEAIAAHATANLLIAAWVITRRDYRLW